MSNPRVKLTVLYGHPADTAAFESYYAATHLPLVKTISALVKTELTKFFDAPDGSKAPYYRMAELYFESAETMQASFASAEGQATSADLANFATGGATLLIGPVEEA